MTTRRPLVAAALCAALSACSGASDAAGDGPPSIVCTTAMVGDLVEAIAGDEAEVTVLFGADVDPHLFRPTRDDVAVMVGADVLFTSGFHLEGYLAPALERVAEGETRVIALAEALSREDQRLDAGGGATDPHLWMDVRLWARGCDVIARELAGLLGEGVRERAEALEARLLALDAEVEAAIAGIDAGSRVLITAHDAFGYFGRRYGVEVHAVQGVSTASEAGLRAIEDLVDLIVERRAPAVFFESTVSERNVRALVEGAAARGHDVRIGGVLHSDAPGEARTYEAMIRHNARAIAEGLGAGAAAGAGADPR